jgi:hypothetical protein
MEENFGGEIAKARGATYGMVSYLLMPSHSPPHSLLHFSFGMRM